MSAESPIARVAGGVGYVSSLLGGISLVSLVATGFSIGWTEPFGAVLAQYEAISASVKVVVEPYLAPLLERIAELFRIRYVLGPHWVDVFLLMVIYLGSRAKAYASSGRYLRSGCMMLVSVPIVLASCFISSMVSVGTWLGGFIEASIPLMGFLAYDVIYACVGASLDKRSGVTWGEEFSRHLRFSLPLLVQCASLNLLLSFVFASDFGLSTHQSFVLIFIVDYVVICLYWAAKSYQHARRRQNRRIGESVWDRFLRSSATSVSVNVGIVIVSALAFLLSNAGMRLATL